MKINLTPQRREDSLEVVKSGNVLIVNGETFDFSPMADGDTLPATAIDSLWFLNKVERVEGELELTMLFPNPWNYSPEQAFPVPLENVPDGLVILPAPLPDPLPPEPETPTETVQVMYVKDNATGKRFVSEVFEIPESDNNE